MHYCMVGIYDNIKMAYYASFNKISSYVTLFLSSLSKDFLKPIMCISFDLDDIISFCVDWTCPQIGLIPPLMQCSS